MNIKWIGTPDLTKGHKAYDYIVMHWSVTTNLQSVDNEVLNPSREMSYHYAIDKNEVHHYVDTANTAWHAGVFDINQRSIGICIVAGPNYPYVDQDYETTAQLIAEMFRKHGRMQIKGHKDFKATECPGNLDLSRIQRRVDEILNPVPQPDPKDTEIASLRAQLSDRDATIVALQNKCNELQSQLTACQSKPPVVQYVDKEVIKEVIREVEKIVEVEVPKEIVKEIIKQVEVEQPLPKDEQFVIDIYRKIKQKLGVK